MKKERASKTKFGRFLDDFGAILSTLEPQSAQNDPKGAPEGRAGQNTEKARNNDQKGGARGGAEAIKPDLAGERKAH